MATKIPTYNYACEAIGLLFAIEHYEKWLQKYLLIIMLVKQSGYFSQLNIMKNGYKNNFSESRSFDDQIEHDTF